MAPPIAGSATRSTPAFSSRSLERRSRSANGAAVLALAIAAAALWRKLGLEEALMRGQFGDAYARYAERVPALIPFVL
jgi:protein-S-isoprenylcysteine O-methyltransferase Ste14